MATPQEMFGLKITYAIRKAVFATIALGNSIVEKTISHLNLTCYSDWQVSA